jgi:quercetin dioxygenase-like cupin family protein
MDITMPDTANMILRNAFNGETFIFPDIPHNANMTGFDVVLEQGGSGGGNALVHVHPIADETFKVRYGRIAVVINGKEQLVGPGQSATVPHGAPHYFRNAGKERAEFTVAFSPAQQQRRFFMNFARLAERRPQWFSAKGDPDLLLIALVLHTYRNHLYLAGIPIILQKILFALLAPIAHLRGYRLEILPNDNFHKQSAKEFHI